MERLRGWLLSHPYVAEHPAIVGIATAGGIASPVLATQPHLVDSTALGELFPGSVVYVWLALYAVGSVGLVFALFQRRPDIETASCVLMAWVIGTNWWALVSQRGEETILASVILFGAALGFALRAVVLLILYPDGR